MPNIAINAVKPSTMSSKRLLYIAGPTAVGKTALSIALAEALNTEIISCDARQCYREMSIGTVVPSEKERAGISHHFIQNKSIFNHFNVGDFEKEALQKLKELFEKKRVVVMVGGSGLYINAIVNGLDSFPKVPPNIRKELNQELVTNGLETLQKELKEVDPTYFKTADIQNPHRIIRALEIIRSSGERYSSFLKNNKNDRPFETQFIGLTADRDILYSRINNRVDHMIASGLAEEAKSLEKNKDLTALQTVGYRELFDFFSGNITQEKAIEEIKKNTRRFAKRQGTWFRKNNQINWFDYSTKAEVIISAIKIKNAL
jgi:tRNA dimethylallyltransferase